MYDLFEITHLYMEFAIKTSLNRFLLNYSQ